MTAEMAQTLGPIDVGLLEVNRTYAYKVGRRVVELCVREAAPEQTNGGPKEAPVADERPGVEEDAAMMEPWFRAPLPEGVRARVVTFGGPLPPPTPIVIPPDDEGEGV